MKYSGYKSGRWSYFGPVSQLYSVLVVWPWASCFTSLYPSFLIYKLRWLILPTPLVIKRFTWANKHCSVSSSTVTMSYSMLKPQNLAWSLVHWRSWMNEQILTCRLIQQSVIDNALSYHKLIWSSASQEINKGNGHNRYHYLHFTSEEPGHWKVEWPDKESTMINNRCDSCS